MLEVVDLHAVQALSTSRCEFVVKKIGVTSKRKERLQVVHSDVVEVAR